MTVIFFMLSMACKKEQTSNYQMLPPWVRQTQKGCAVGSARFRSDVGEVNTEKALKMATQRATEGLKRWIENSCEVYLRDPEQLCSPCMTTNNIMLELEKDKFSKKLIEKKTITNQVEHNDFMHVEICIDEKNIQSIGDEAGYAGEELNPDIVYCMNKMTDNLRRKITIKSDTSSQD